MNKLKQWPNDLTNLIRIEIHLTGLVQGVGFRPHVYRLAKRSHLAGWVINTAQGVTLQIEGKKHSLDRFLILLEDELPPHAKILSKEKQTIQPTGEVGFQIRESQSSGKIVPLVLPDIAVCPECLGELFDPKNRRYRYPFINCTHCGPRFSIIQSLPYDRPNTTMSGFELCPECRNEYENPEDRRFHAQPNACPKCGPQVYFHKEPTSAPTDSGEDAIIAAFASIRRGHILALKGLGGFQLVVDAENTEAVLSLRERKQRGNKPFAVMFPDIQSIHNSTVISEQEQRLIESSEAPIVLVEKRDDHFDSAAPANPYLGVFLPYTPLHHLLLQLFKTPLIITSGNLSNEPICKDNDEAFAKLKNIADTFLVHDRPIQRPVDDSVVRIISGKPQILRRARGYAPLPIEVGIPLKPTLAAGGHLKNTIAIGKDNKIILSQYIGNLDTTESTEVFEATISDFENLYDLKTEVAIYDKHPDYFSSHFIRTRYKEISKQSVQHHLAHVFSCMAEHALEPPLLGISWDGTGYGEDGSIWGAESFILDKVACKRFASIDSFRLPGGESAIKAPSRVATSLLFESGYEFSKGDKNKLFVQLLDRNLHAPLCSSMGRLFDGVSAILGLCERIDYEGEAAMLLEFEAQKSATKEAYAIEISQLADEGAFIFDWRTMIKGIQADTKSKTPAPRIARKFHNTLVLLIVEIAKMSGQEVVVLTGGCFQNKLLSELAISKLTDTGFNTYTHQQIPPNDSGIAAGQVFSSLYPSIL